MYYLGSRYYDSEVGRFINADGYVSTGIGLLGHNVYAYCNSNPVNMIDIGGSMPTGIADAYLPKMTTIPMPDTEDVINNLPGPTIDAVVDTVSNSLPNEPRPNNIGVGTWQKQIDDQLKNIDSFSKNVNILLDKLAYVGVVTETAGNIYRNSMEGVSVPKIAWDATVDTMILTANAYISAEIGVAVGGVATAAGFGPVGVIVWGVGSGLLIDGGLNWLTKKPREELKEWVK